MQGNTQGLVFTQVKVFENGSTTVTTTPARLIPDAALADVVHVNEIDAQASSAWSYAYAESDAAAAALPAGKWRTVAADAAKYFALSDGHLTLYVKSGGSVVVSWTAWGFKANG